MLWRSSKSHGRYDQARPRLLAKIRHSPLAITRGDQVDEYELLFRDDRNDHSDSNLRFTQL